MQLHFTLGYVDARLAYDARTSTRYQLGVMEEVGVVLASGSNRWVPFVLG